MWAATIAVATAWLVAGAGAGAGADAGAGAGSQRSCPDARLRCAYRSGCGSALSSYMELCADVMAEPAERCPEPCQHALIALTSTEEGKDLMNCECKDDYCIQTKERIDICRPQVLLGAANATASCRLSQLICAANAQCATALEYYHRFCRSMYQGRKCSNKCLNSIQILRKQEKAAALSTCKCDGQEEYDCPRMQNNLARLCFHKHKNNHNKTNGGHKRTHTRVKEPKRDAASAIVMSHVLLLVPFVQIGLFNT